VFKRVLSINTPATTCHIRFKKKNNININIPFHASVVPCFFPQISTSCPFTVTFFSRWAYKEVSPVAMSIRGADHLGMKNSSHPKGEAHIIQCMYTNTLANLNQFNLKSI